MPTVEKDQVATLRDAEAVRDSVNAKYLESRREHELANMSPDIRPEHYDECMTQTMVAIVADADGTFLVDVHPEEAATKPEGATRVVVDTVTGLKTAKPQQPPEKPIDAEPVGEVDEAVEAEGVRR